MISIILLFLIYMAFISLGLPDSILGVALPAIQQEWGFPLSTGGLISFTVVGSTIISSFCSAYIIDKFGTGKIVLLSCLITGTSLFGFSLAPSFFWLIMLAVPLGLGGGTVDAALNNYVALHYKAHHMNWLHSFWGVGATLGPVIMSVYLNNHSSWRSGYRTISFIQLSLALILLLSLPFWDKAGRVPDHKKVRKDRVKSIFKIKGVPAAVTTMMLYCAVEASIGLWGSTYLIKARDFSIETAASWLALYYGGITVGRFLSGIISFRLSNVQMIRGGMILAFIGILILLPDLNKVLSGAAIVFIGVGLAPIFPSMLHETPNRFGRELSQILIGYQMGFAYIGSAVLSPLIGVVLQHTAVSLFPVYLTGIVFIMFLVSEVLISSTKNRIALTE